MDGNRIPAVGSRLHGPAGAHVIDLGDATLLPGFIDAHTHLTDESSDDWNADTVNGLRRTMPKTRSPPNSPGARCRPASPRVRDVGSSDYIDVGLRNAIATGIDVGPRMLVAVHALGARGGHCDDAGYPPERFGTSPASRTASPTAPTSSATPCGSRSSTAPTSSRSAPRAACCRWPTRSDTPQLTQAEIDAIVEEAHRCGSKMAAHAHGAEGAKVAIRAGIDSIEHGSFLDDEAVRLMKERGT